jgi:hypothetical protein
MTKIATIDPKLVDQLLETYQNPEDLLEQVWRVLEWPVNTRVSQGLSSRIPAGGATRNWAVTRQVHTRARKLAFALVTNQFLTTHVSRV